MVRVAQASQLTLHDVEAKFGLRLETGADFFPEWQVAPVALDAYQARVLDQAQAHFRYLLAYPVHEELVKMVIISPLLSVAGFYERPFRPIAEETIEIALKANDELVRGRVDILVLNEQIWVATIEAKGPQFSWHVGLPQVLTYMVSGDQPSGVRFGLVTNGTDLIFVKLNKETGQYGLSKTFSIFNPGNELHHVVAVLKTLSNP
ncbi:type I restriction enzyme HsdR N-terminal domain-containing protein [Leptolyngbya cf. ectocarpi LEGE 11479]|uniref:Type I restriction enzyme HsdR N-terminal domain-containing protein n=1 Tax=Leptolyngbya cf. ectocarpi LEGE 11479 TaxID=1828722 RepID=A0A928ZWA5_LEPEC|nr:type I restriction enzyme HsdR N-terminal domain-containing protein [Leptolyngbya ectocarpi]MBE9068626.1 type I restriction enzyme HsdR N-terminal domain-containing protein [Leptolyngbya cf. ectocarpi LEGE 11479]